MSWTFYASASGVTPVVGVPTIVLEAGAGEYGEIIEFNFGGEATTSTAMRTAVRRAVEGIGAATAVTSQLHEEGSPTSSLSSTLGDHATVAPAAEAGALFTGSWNAQGGQLTWFAEPREEIVLLGVSTVVQENAVGVAVSSYGFRWREHN